MSRQRNGAHVPALSRREFARGAALAAAAIVLPRGGSAHEAAVTSTSNTQSAALSPAGEAQVQAILAKYSNRFSDEQRAELRRLVAQTLKTSETLRSLPLDNSDEPAMIFHIYRSDRR